MSERADARKRREEAEEYPKAGWRGEVLTGPIARAVETQAEREGIPAYLPIPTHKRRWGA